MCVWPVPLEVYCLWWWWWLWLCSLAHSAAWCWTPPLLHCFPCHELVFSVFPGRGLSPWHETKGSHSQGPQATQVCSSSPHTLLSPVWLSQQSALWFPLHLFDLVHVVQQILWNFCSDHSCSGCLMFLCLSRCGPLCVKVEAQLYHDLVRDQFSKTIFLL